MASCPDSQGERLKVTVLSGDNPDPYFYGEVVKPLLDGRGCIGDGVYYLLLDDPDYQVDSEAEFRLVGLSVVRAGLLDLQIQKTSLFGRKLPEDLWWSYHQKFRFVPLDGNEVHEFLVESLDREARVLRSYRFRVNRNGVVLTTSCPDTPIAGALPA